MAPKQTMTPKQGGWGKCSCRRQEGQDSPCTLCKDQTFKRTSSELQYLSHTNELMGNDRDTIFAMVCTPSSTRGLILWTGPSSDPLTIEHHQRHVHLACENKTFSLPWRQHRFSDRNTGSNSLASLSEMLRVEPSVLTSSLSLHRHPHKLYVFPVYTL